MVDEETKNESKSKDGKMSKSRTRAEPTHLDMGSQLKVTTILPPYAGFTIPDENIAARFDMQYIMAVHPLPVLEAQYLVCQLEDPPLDGQSVLKDYALFRRKEITPRVMKERREHTINPTSVRDRATPRVQGNQPQDNHIDMNASADPVYEIDKSFLLSLDVDNKMPLSEWDWRYWYQAVYDCQGVGFLQILPLGYRR